jgi:hypothetical protein
MCGNSVRPRLDRAPWPRQVRPIVIALSILGALLVAVLVLLLLALCRAAAVGDDADEARLIRYGENLAAHTSHPNSGNVCHVVPQEEPSP